MTRAVFLSILLHALIIVALIAHFQVNKIAVGNNVTLKAYVYHTPFLIKKSPKVAGKISVVSRNNKLFRKGNLLSQSQNNYSENSIAQKTLSGKYDSLAIILHNLIQKHLAYFDSLSLAAGDRVVQVEFDLSPNGSIDAIAVQHSSGVLLFDKLAKQAVTKIQPVKEAVHFLHKKQRFVIRVEFA
ncbi:MAG: TonB family protein [Gammaproteobacteria bacterium]|jgi:TonB family protein